MRVDKTNGEVEIIENVTKEQIERALADPDNARVSVFRPGEEVTRSNGRRYRMNKRGQWERVK